MKYFKLFEQFVSENKKSVNEANNFYTLQDMIDDNRDEKDLQKAAAMCAVTLGLSPDRVAIITNEDDDYDKYDKKYRNAKFKSFDNPSAEMETAHSATDNVVYFKDASTSGYFIPVDRMNEGIVNEAKIEYSLNDLMGDSPNKEYTKMCELIARTIGEDPKNIAVITSEDDDFPEYQAKFKNSPTSAMNNPSAETSTYYDKKNNVVTSNDGSAIAYYIPANQLL
jgi:hypothetical protein